MSTGCKSSHNGFLDVSRSNGGLKISNWIGQLSCLTIFSTSLSVAAFLRRAGGSMLESTGSHGRGVERRNRTIQCSVCVTVHFVCWRVYALLPFYVLMYLLIPHTNTVQPNKSLHYLLIVLYKLNGSDGKMREV